MLPSLLFLLVCSCIFSVFFFFQAEDGIRDLVRSRGLGDVYKRQVIIRYESDDGLPDRCIVRPFSNNGAIINSCLLYTSDAADERSSVDLGGRRIIKKKKYTQKNKKKKNKNRKYKAYIQTQPHRQRV